MTSTTSVEAPPRRRRIIEDMCVRKWGEKTQHDYIRHIEQFAKFLGRSPDTATGEDLRRYQVHQTATGVQPPSVNSSAVALRFLFTVTLGRANLATQLTRVHYPRRLPRVLSPEGCTIARSGARSRPQVQGGAERCLRCRAARVRSGLAEGLRYRQQAPIDPGGAGQGPQGSPRDALSRAARTSTRLVSCCAATGLAVPGPEPGQPDVDTPTHARLPCRSPHGRDRQTGVPAYAATQLCNASARAEHRYSGDPSPARSNDILPANARSRGGSTIRSIRGAARQG